MRRGRIAAIIAGMTPDRGEILVSLDLDAPAIAGDVSVAGTPATPFTGWLGLMSALNAASAAIRDANPPAGEGSASAPRDSAAGIKATEGGTL